MSTVLITGQTYPVREQLKALGGKWVKKERGWRVPADKADEARALMEIKQLPGELLPADRYDDRHDNYQSDLIVFSSGAEIYRNKRGRCIDAPCCGCCNP